MSRSVRTRASSASSWAASAGSAATAAVAGSAAVVVNKVSVGLLGTIGGTLAILGVVVCPITSGDTAFRSLRLIIADAIHLPQKKIASRFLITIPTFILAIVVSCLDNLIKGAAGQAMENMNLMFGFAHAAGLPVLPWQI